MGNSQGAAARASALAKRIKWVDAQQLHQQDPKSYFAPEEEQLLQLKRGDHVKLISSNASERYWAEVLRAPAGGCVDVMIRGDLSAFDNLTRDTLSQDVEMSVQLANVCDIRKRMRRRSMHAINKNKTREAARNLVRETNASQVESLGDAMSSELGSSTVYRTAEMLFKQGKINEEQFNNLIENPDSYADAVAAMKEVVTAFDRKSAGDGNGSLGGAKSKKSKKDPSKKGRRKNDKRAKITSDTKSSSLNGGGGGESKAADSRSGRSGTASTTSTGGTSKSLDGTIAELKQHHEDAAHYKRIVLENVIDMFIRFEKRKPTNMELADLTVEVSDSVLYDQSLVDQTLHDDEFTDLIQKLAAPIETHDRVEKRLHSWLVEETRDLQLQFRTQEHFREIQEMEEKEAMDTIMEEPSGDESEDGGRRSSSSSPPPLASPSGAPTNNRQDSPLKMKRERTSSEQLVLLV